MSERTRLNGPSSDETGSMAYQKECMFALEPSISKLIMIAIAAGWDRDQVLHAITCLAAREATDKQYLS